MDEMLGYIFGRLKLSEDALRSINGTLRSQNLLNRRVALFALLVTANIAVMGIHIHEQNEKIKKLSEEIKAMKEPTESCTGSTESES